MDLVPAVAGLFPVGRLDVTTEGLILLTNDGAFAERVAHPRYETPRVYLAKVRSVPDAATFERMRKGVTVEGDRLAVDRVRLVESDKNSWVELTLHEGKHHEVRRLLEAVGHPVSKLQRVSVGPVTLKGLAVGEYRSLTPHEIQGLLKPPSQAAGAALRAGRARAPRFRTARPRSRVRARSRRRPSARPRPASPKAAATARRPAAAASRTGRPSGREASAGRDGQPAAVRRPDREWSSDRKPSSGRDSSADAAVERSRPVRRAGFAFRPRFVGRRESSVRSEAVVRSASRRAGRDASNDRARSGERGSYSGRGRPRAGVLPRVVVVCGSRIFRRQWFVRRPRPQAVRRPRLRQGRQARPHARMTPHRPRGLVIAIDGPSGAGKSTVGRALARRLGYVFLDTGAMYRALALKALRTRHRRSTTPPAWRRSRTTSASASRTRAGASCSTARTSARDLRTREVSQAASRVSVHPPVRREMVRRAAGHGPRGRRRARRARHRHRRLPGRGREVLRGRRSRAARDATARGAGRARGAPRDLAAIEREIRERDHADSTRADSPLTRAADAIVIDTTDDTPDAVVARMMEAVARG